MNLHGWICEFTLQIHYCLWIRFALCRVLVSRFTVVSKFTLLITCSFSADSLFSVILSCRLLSRQIEFKMSWNPCMEVRYNNISYPYSAAGTFIEYVEGLTYEHVNFIFSGASHAQVHSEILSTFCLRHWYKFLHPFYCFLFCRSVWMTLLSLKIQCRTFKSKWSNIE